MMYNWLLFALGSAFFAALTAVFGKIGVADINSDLATFIRTIVIIAVTIIIISARKEWQMPEQLSRQGLLMIILSGIATGLSWLCYYRALQLGQAAKVASVDKLSVVMVILLSVLFLNQTLNWKIILGSAFICAGAVLVSLP